MDKLSFVIPCYGSELTIEGVLDEIHMIMSQKQEYDYEIICVNDCSEDNVLEILKKRALNEPELVIADLTKNMGKPCAMLAGYSLVSGDYVVNLDDDGQCPLDKLWNLFAPLQSGSDVVYAGYTKKKQSTFKNFGSKVNSTMAQVLVGKPKWMKTSNFSIMKRVIVDEIRKYTNIYPYISGIAFKTTSAIANVPMEERERTAGRSNFTLRKSFSLWLNGFTAFSVRPLRLSTLIGVLTAVAGLVYGLYIAIRRLFIVPHMRVGYASTMIALLIIGGIIMMMLGMLGEYIGRIYVNQNNLPQYVIREVINGGQANEEHPYIRRR